MNDLLDLAKLQRGKTSAALLARRAFRRDPVDLFAFRGTGRVQEASYVIDVPQAIEVEVDVEKYERVLLNLLSNAFKFLPIGGRIRCSLNTIDPQKVLLSVQG